MTPLQFLTLILTVTVYAAVVSNIAAAVRHRRLSRLARGWRMHYTRHDRLLLADRLAACFPIPGVADVWVVDLFFQTEAGLHEYILTVEYTIGLVHNKRRVRRAAACAEQVHGNDAILNLRLAPEHLPMKRQYEALYSERAPRA